MMRKAACSIGIGLIGLLAIEFADVRHSLAFADENVIDPTRFAYNPRDSREPAAAEPYGFDIAGDEFALTPTGAILPKNSSVALRLRIAEEQENDILFGSIAADHARPGRIATSNQIGNDSAVAAAECGPSPMTAEEIRELVIGAARRHGVDRDLAMAVASVESDFDRDRNSPKGARGPMQLMPATAARFGVSDPCEPAANIDAGVRYLGLLLAEFDNPILAIAAYNAGEDRIYEYGGVPPFPETVAYVAKVVNHRLGLPMPQRDPTGGSHRTAANEASERGVVLTDKRRQWIGGVMQF